jgi:hypothetical protein
MIPAAERPLPLPVVPPDASLEFAPSESVLIVKKVAPIAGPKPSCVLQRDSYKPLAKQASTSVFHQWCYSRSSFGSQLPYQQTQTQLC